jgi:hypothetical protein
MYWRLISQPRISICTGENSYHTWCCVDELCSGGADNVILKYDASTLRGVGTSSIGGRGSSSFVEQYGDHEVSIPLACTGLGMTSGG